MKKIFSFLLGAALLVPSVFTNRFKNFSANAEISAISVSSQAESQVDLGIHAKAAYMMDSASGTEIYSENATNRLPIASMCKIMTLILCFDEIEKGTLTTEETVTVSEKSASMGGSQVFLEAGGAYPVRELLKSIVVCSANDSCVAMAERVAGSENLFVERMNARAKELGAENTLFANCTGLPKEPQYSCAKDVAIFLSELVSHEEYFSLSKIWMDRFQHPKGRYTDISNTNRLVRFYEGCDGGKTGFTSQAGFCLAATAKRGAMRIVSVVIGSDSSDNRFGAVRTMFDYAFANYALKTVVDENNPLNESAVISGGKRDSVSIKPARSSYIFSKKGTNENITMELRLKKTVKAPVRAGDKIGEIIVYKDNVEIDRVIAVAAESVKRASFADRMKKIAKGWNL